VALGEIRVLTLVAFLPVIVRGLLGIRTPENKLNFVRIGWMEVAYSIVFASASIFAMRLVI